MICRKHSIRKGFYNSPHLSKIVFSELSLTAVIIPTILAGRLCSGAGS